jgi:hypothetical protein
MKTLDKKVLKDGSNYKFYLNEDLGEALNQLIQEVTDARKIIAMLQYRVTELEKLK